MLLPRTCAEYGASADTGHADGRRSKRAGTFSVIGKGAGVRGRLPGRFSIDPLLCELKSPPAATHSRQCCPRPSLLPRAGAKWSAGFPR